MAGLTVGEKVEVRYLDGGKTRYTLDLEVRVVCSDKQFIGTSETVFAKGTGEMTGSEILDWLGKEIRFTSEDIIARRSDPT